MSARRLPWHRRLEAHVVGGLSLLVLLSLTAFLIETEHAVIARALQRASSDLDAARAAFDRLADDRAEFASAQAMLIAGLPVFRAHLTNPRIARDLATIEAMADEYRRQLNADFSIVTDHSGRWTGHPGWPSSADPPAAIQAAIGAALRGR